MPNAEGRLLPPGGGGVSGGPIRNVTSGGNRSGSISGAGSVNLAMLQRGGPVGIDSGIVRHTLPRSKQERRGPATSGG